MWKYKNPMSCGHGEMVGQSPGLRFITTVMTVPRIFCATPGNARVAAGMTFGRNPFPFPAIARPVSTDDFRDLSHGTWRIVVEIP
jgi:hypothetical protein